MGTRSYWWALAYRLVGTARRQIAAGAGIVSTGLGYLFMDRVIGWANKQLDDQGAASMISQVLAKAAEYPGVATAIAAFVLPVAYVMRQARLAKRDIRDVGDPRPAPPVTTQPPPPAGHAPAPPTTTPEVIFGPTKNGAGEDFLKWWHVPVSSTARLEGCRIFALVEGRKVPLRWPTWQGPAEHWTLRASEEPRAIPVCLRSEIALDRAPAARGSLEACAARITDSSYFMGDAQNYVTVGTGIHELRLLLTSDAGDWTSPPYRLAVPIAHGNLNFDLRRLAEDESIFEPPDDAKTWGIEQQWLALYYQPPFDKLVPQGVPVVFGQPAQEGWRPHLSWWFIGITPLRRVPDCRVFIVHDNRDLPTIFQSRKLEDDFESGILTVDPAQSDLSVAVAIRAERRDANYDLPGGTARLCTRPFYKIRMALPEEYVDLAPGIHEIRVKITAQTGDAWVSQAYWLRVPESWESNGGFTLTRERPAVAVATLPDAEAARMRRRHAAPELAKWLPFARRLAARIEQTPERAWTGALASKNQVEAEQLTAAIVPCVATFSPARAADFRLTQLRDGDKVIVLESAGKPPAAQKPLALYTAETARLLGILVEQLDAELGGLPVHTGHHAVGQIDLPVVDRLESLVARVHEARDTVLLEGERYTSTNFLAAVQTLRTYLHDNESRIDEATAEAFSTYLTAADAYGYALQDAEEDDGDRDRLTTTDRGCADARRALTAMLRGLRQRLA